MKNALCAIRHDAIKGKNHRKTQSLSVLFTAVLALCITFNAGANAGAKVLSVELENNVLMVDTEHLDYSVTALSTNAFVVLYDVDEQPIQSFALPKERDNSVALTLTQHDDHYAYGDQKMAVNIDKASGRLRFFYQGREKLAEESGFYAYPAMRGVRFTVKEHEQFYGGGQRVLGMDRRGQRLPLYNRAHYGYSTESSQMYYSLPAVISSDNYAVLFDNSAKGHLDIAATESDVLHFSAVAGRASYIVVLGDSLQQVSQKIAGTTGLHALPPRWALGNFASRFGYRNQQETLDTAQLFREKNMPLDAIVLDLYWFGEDIQGHMGNLQWDRQHWPTPEKMISKLQDDNVNTVIITEPFILTTSSQWENAVAANALAVGLNGEPKTFDFYFGNTGLVDVFSQQGKDWFNQFYVNLYQQGIRGWWGDLGEPEVHPHDALHQVEGILRSADEIHNAYGHQWAENVYDITRQIAPEERPFIMMRAGFLGSQRYGLIPWTGDVSRSWGGLQSQVELALQMSLFGLSYIHSDVGGFAGGENFDSELYKRWVQHSVFSPVFRPHAQDNIAPEPVFHSPDVVSLARDYLNIRYALTPYLYSAALENAMTGMPIMRPVSFIEASQFDNKDSYLLGEALWVAPIIQPGQREITTYIPQGEWHHFFTGEHIAGGQTATLSAPMEQLPVLVKAGSFIPSIAPQPHLADYTSKEVTLTHYVGGDDYQSHSVWYEDDGRTPDTIANNQYQAIHMSASRVGQALSIQYTVQGDYLNAPQSRQVTTVLQGISASSIQLEINGQAKPFSYRDNKVVFTHTLTDDASISVLIND